MEVILLVLTIDIILFYISWTIENKGNEYWSVNPSNASGKILLLEEHLDPEVCDNFYFYWIFSSC